MSTTILILTVFHLLLSSAAVNGEEATIFTTTLQPKKLLKQKLTHFRLYFHDIVSGKNPTAVPIVKPPRSNNPRSFGLVSMIDDPLTAGPDLSSKTVGRAQGFYAQASKEGEFGLMMNMNFVFTEGKYNGSTISILGRNAILNKVRELPVVGGSGLFRFASGYARATTYRYDLKTGDAVVQYNVYVLHY